MTRLLLATVATLLTLNAFADNGLDRVRRHQPEMSYLDNGTVRLGIDLHLGGSITYLSRSGSDENLVNSFDFGRQIQMSYYAGPVPFTLPGKEPKPEWKYIGWNPIQVGDAFGNASKILESRNDGKQLYVKCVPMHWPLDNVPGECTYECWFELEGPAVHAHCRLVNNRPDHTQYPARGQELPAIYTNGPWYKLMTYAGDQPFTGGALTRIEKKIGEPGPWSGWIATESWAALVDDHDFGVGVFIPSVCHFTGGFAGQPGKGGPHDDPTGYIAPNPVELIDWNITHEYRYDLIVGQLSDIRRYVYDHKPTRSSRWRFDQDRQGWSYVNATDAGWPIRGELDVKLEANDPQLIGPIGLWRAKSFVLEAASHATRTHARLFWRRWADDGFADERSAGVTLTNDGQYHTYRVSLPADAGPLTQIRFDPIGAGKPGDWIKVKSITLEP